MELTSECLSCLVKVLVGEVNTETELLVESLPCLSVSDLTMALMIVALIVCVLLHVCFLSSRATCRQENADSMKQVMMLRQEDLISNDDTHGTVEGVTELSPDKQEELLRSQIQTLA